MAYASVQNLHGSPAINVDGEWLPPMSMTTPICKPEYLRQLGKAGMRVFFLMAQTRWLSPTAFEDFTAEAELLLREVPNAYIIVRLDLNPPAKWIEDHPNDIMRYNDGSTQPAILMTEIRSQRVPGMFSLCADAWRHDARAALFDFCDEVDKSPFAGRVIGYFLAAGGTSEWYPVNKLTDRARGLYADCSPAFKKEFGRVLREKYGTEQALRAAWNNPGASFDDPPIPDIPSRAVERVDDMILDALVHFEDAERIIGKELEINPESPYNLGVFLNAEHYTHVADFFYAWHRGTANSIVFFARALKERYAGKLVGAFYGSYGCTEFFELGTAGATLPILDSGCLDFLAAPGVYNNREPGGYLAQREMQDSFRLRGQIFVCEEDSRTHLENDFYRDAMGLYDIEDSLNTLKRDFGRILCEDVYAWWFDQHEKGGRYDHEALYALFRRQQQIAEEAYALPREKHNEIALVYDQESLFYVSDATNAHILDYYRSSDLGRIGAPVDYYFHNDMARDDMPDYKLYLMLNLFCLSDSERAAIHRKAAKNGAVVVWLYAPGFVNPGRAQKMSNGYITELTGFGVGRTDETTSPRFKLCGGHKATKYGLPERRYGYIDRDVHSNVWLKPVLSPPYANPQFFIEDAEAEILGRYLINGKAAFGLKQYKGFTSVYCCAQILRAELLASLAEYAGCHLYTHSDDFLCANEHFVMVHAATSGKRTLRFKKPCDPYEVYGQTYHGQGVAELVLDMKLGKTLMFRLDNQQ